ncbi:amastigote surface protein 4, partial [Trypanosoma cruzi]
SGAASNENTLTDSELPKRKLFHWKDTTDEVTVILLRVPSLVEMNGDVFAVAEAKGTKKEEGGFTGIASELLTLTGQNPKEELDKTKLKTQVLEECSSGKEECPTQAVDEAGTKSGARIHVSKPTTVVHGSDIYMIAENYGLYGVAAAGEDITDEWGLLLARGNVSVDDGDGKRIYWTDVDALPITSNTEQYGYVTELLGSGGSGVKMEDGTLVFPMEGEVYRTGKADEENTAEGSNIVSLFIYFPDNKSWKLSKGMSADGCSVPSVVEWKDKLMMMTACDGGRRVYESGDKGDSWTEALGTLSRVWGNKYEGNVWGVRSGFTTAKIGDNRDVMLVTLPVYSSKDGNGKGVLHLWLTDNTHIVDIGPVSGEEEDVAASSLLYKSTESKDRKDELIALYEESGDEDASIGMASVLLTAQLEKVKEVLKTWKKADERVSQLCSTLLAGKVAFTDNACSSADGKITDGLVGFLSGNFSDKTWKDEYLGVNATVKGSDGATNTSDGVTFQGAWAEWPVGSQGENQLYHFANYNFTLVATVSIDGVPKEDTPIPLLGARAGSNGGKKLMELSYDSGKKWILLCGDGTNEELSSVLGAEKTQHVVILLRNGNQSSAYVDGQRVGGNAPCELENTDSKEISHFYIGGDGDKTREQEDVSVTVKNVLLYNRPLDSTEIDAYNPNKASIPFLVNTTIEGTVSSSTAGRQQQAGKEPLLESSIANGETAGGMDGQEEEVNTQVRDVNAAALNSGLGNVSQGNNSAAGALRESRLLPSLLLLLGLWGFAA